MQMASAQTRRVFLFEKFTPAKVRLKSKGVVSYIMNYDSCNGKMMFLEGEDMMELTNVATVDTISWGERKFVPFKNKFAEVVQMPAGKVFVDWVIRDVVVGKKGALGRQTGGSVHNLRMHEFSEPGVIPGVDRYTPYESDGSANDIWKRSNNNNYYIFVNGQLLKITNEKSLIKAFPAHADEIRQYKQSHDIDYKDALSALEIINYAMGL